MKSLLNTNINYVIKLDNQVRKINFKLETKDDKLWQFENVHNSRNICWFWIVVLFLIIYFEQAKKLFIKILLLNISSEILKLC